MKKWIQKGATKFKRPPAKIAKLYNRIHPFYGFIERNMGPRLDDILADLQNELQFGGKCTAIEYACGSGLLTRKLHPLFHMVTARDFSAGMLDRAQRLAGTTTKNILFERGNILSIPDADNAFDFAFVSFGLHLFSPPKQKEILQELQRITRKEVIIIDHIPKWELGIALLELFEGSHYDDFINTNWRDVAAELNATFSRKIVTNCQVQRWKSNPSNV